MLWRTADGNSGRSASSFRASRWILSRTSAGFAIPFVSRARCKVARAYSSSSLSAGFLAGPQFQQDARQFLALDYGAESSFGPRDQRMAKHRRRDLFQAVRSNPGIDLIEDCYHAANQMPAPPAECARDQLGQHSYRGAHEQHDD